MQRAQSAVDFSNLLNPTAPAEKEPEKSQQGDVEMATAAWPWSVNLMALPRRFVRICLAPTSVLCAIGPSTAWSTRPVTSALTLARSLTPASSLVAARSFLDLMSLLATPAFTTTPTQGEATRLLKHTSSSSIKCTSRAFPIICFLME